MNNKQSTEIQEPEEQRIVLPTAEAKPLELESFTELVSAAIRRTHADLQAREQVPSLNRLVYRYVDGDHRGDQLSAPHYYQPLLLQVFERIWDTPEFMSLADYLWDHGARRGEYQGKIQSLDAWRRDYARHQFVEFVQNPIMKVLERTARERLVATGHVRSWDADPEQIFMAIRDLTDWYVGKRHAATGFCLLCVELPRNADYWFAHDIRLRHWTPQERCVFATEHSSRFSEDDWFQCMPMDERRTAIGEFSAPTPRVNIWSHPHPVIEPLFSAVDLLKWAVFLVLNVHGPIAEGPCIVQGRNGATYDTVRRRAQHFAFPPKIDEHAFERCKDLITRFRAVEKQTSDISMALWHFGRSCTAHQERDALLEAAIGLELLVASGAGENSYRFRLHGATLLATSGASGVEVHEQLKKIYEMRSKAAHGSAKGSASPLASDARKLLAKAMHAVVALVENNQLDVSKGVAVGVQQLVLRRATAPFPCTSSVEVQVRTEEAEPGAK